MPHAKRQTQDIPRTRPRVLELIVLRDQVEHAEEVVERIPDDEYPLPAEAAVSPPCWQGGVCFLSERGIHPGAEDEVLVQGELEGCC